MKLKYAAYENASRFFDEAKKLKAKLTSLEKARGEVQQLQFARQEHVEAVKTPPLRKLEEKKWYEKYHYFTSSEGFLVVAGKDASSNEALIRRHTQPQDIVFHADIAGAPFVVVKTQERTPGEPTLHEAAQFAVVHSRAWTQEMGALDVYWVTPHQITKQPPPGEYLTHGAFMIRGKRNYIPKIPLQLALGVKIEDDKILFVAAPPSAMKTLTPYYVEVGPGDRAARDLLPKLKAMLTAKIPEELRLKVAKVPFEPLIPLIPYGKLLL